MIENTWSVLLELAQWRLLGMGVAGFLHVVLPDGLVARQLRGTSGVAKAVTLGVPLPLCSCGVIPAGLGLKQDGASDGSAIRMRDHGCGVATPGCVTSGDEQRRGVLHRLSGHGWGAVFA